MGDLESYQLAAVALGASFCGLALVFALSLEPTRANLANAASGVGVGISFATPLFFLDDVSTSAPGLLPRLQGLSEVSVGVFSAIYMASLFRTAQMTPRARTAARWVIRAGWAEIAWFAAVVLLFPAQRLNDYELSAFDRSAHDEPGFWLFAITLLVIGVTFMAGWALLATQQIDPAERARAIATSVASGLLACSTAVPWEASGVLAVLVMSLVTWGHMHYGAAHARRATFLGQFLSPQVSEMIEAKGISTVMRPHQAELSVIECDLRDFTPYSEGVPSQAVVDLLAEYYDAVGEVVARHGGTITCYAGDGVLMLVGAPLPRPDHAAVAVALAEDLITAVDPVLERWATKLHPLGVGVGVASGTVTVGTIGSSNRLDYTAVGTPVNLAARLCSAARAGEVLLDERTAQLAADTRVQQRDPMRIKGLVGLQSVFELTAPTL
ncbi:adenylate/guanylate cyclase domain-containing protein [Nocardioides stalactiti]|uniref:adenylate/guanylate cyclase domain-containing protein n=1 Tax=Nocardioides stalactiti TaxID=2755356 RepID=UPI001604656D|nr:adenylate/guanylate cyclase domain-containing protein [Nocardioides stalactiti]